MITEYFTDRLGNNLPLNVVRIDDNGELKTRVYSYAYHYNGEKCIPNFIDTLDPDYNYECVKDPLQKYIKVDSSEIFNIKIERNNKMMFLDTRQLRWNNGTDIEIISDTLPVTGTVLDNMLTYVNIFGTNYDDIWTSIQEQFRHQLKIKAQPAAPTISTNNLFLEYITVIQGFSGMQFEIDGIIYSDLTTLNITNITTDINIIDSNNILIFKIQKPYISDSDVGINNNKQAIIYDLKTIANEIQLIKRIDYTILTNVSWTYPLLVDIIINSEEAGHNIEDIHVRGDLPTSNRDGFDLLLAPIGSLYPSNCFYRIKNVTTPPSGPGELKLTLSFNNGLNQTARVYLCLQPWTETGADKVTYDGVNPWNGEGHDLTPDIDYDSTESNTIYIPGNTAVGSEIIVPLLQSWINNWVNNPTNNGIVIIGESPNYGTLNQQFYQTTDANPANRPYLEYPVVDTDVPQIINLTASTGKNDEEIDLSFDAPDEDAGNPTGSACTAYEMKWSLSDITNETDYDNANAYSPVAGFELPTPATPGTAELFTVKDSTWTPGQTIYVAIKGVDEENNKSIFATSCVDSADTASIPQETVPATVPSGSIKSKSAQLTVTVDRNSTGYVRVIPGGDPDPTSLEIKNNADYTQSMEASVEEIFDLIGLSPNTSYKACFVPENGLAPDPTIIPFTTDSQTLTSITIAPDTANIILETTKDFTATWYDQYGETMPPSGTNEWSLWETDEATQSAICVLSDATDSSVTLEGITEGNCKLKYKNSESEIEDFTSTLEVSIMSLTIIKGTSAKLRAGVQTQWGTKVAPTIELPITSASIKPTRNTEKSAILSSGRAAESNIHTDFTVGGGFEVEVDPKTLFYLLHWSTGHNPTPEVLAAGEAWKREFIPVDSEALLSYLSFEDVRNTNNVYTHDSAVVNTITFNQSDKGRLKATIDLVARNSVVDTFTTGLSLVKDSAFTFNMIKVYYRDHGDVDWIELKPAKSITATHGNDVLSEVTAGENGRIGFAVPGELITEGQNITLTLSEENAHMIEKSLSDSAYVDFKIEFVGPQIGTTGYYKTFSIEHYKAVVKDSYSEVSGKGLLDLNVTYDPEKESGIMPVKYTLINDVEEYYV